MNTEVPSRVLLVGGGGHVGRILRPAFEAQYEVYYYDLNPVPDAESRTTVGDVIDKSAVQRAVADMDVVVYLAMGAVSHEDKAEHARSNFEVNVHGVYRVLKEAMRAGVRRFVYASSLSVYDNIARSPGTDESTPTNAWDVYGVSKRLGEHVCEMAAARYPDASVTALRLMRPLDEQQFEKYQKREHSEKLSHPTGPEDIRRLFMAAVALDEPGMHTIQATGDKEGVYYPLTRARQVLGWSPQGE